MPRVTICKRTKIIRNPRGSGFSGFVYDLPNAWIDLPEAGALAQMMAMMSQTSIRMGLANGVDAAGSKLTPAQSTLDRRRADMHAPTTSYRRRRASARRKARTSSVRADRARYSLRYPDGRGSMAGSTALTDSGYLGREIAVSVERMGRRAVAIVRVPSARIPAVLAIEAGGGVSKKTGRAWHTFGGVPHPIFSVQARTVDGVAESTLDTAVDGMRPGGGSASSAFGRGAASVLGKVGGQAGVLAVFAAARGMI